MFTKIIGSVLTAVFMIGLAGSISGCNTVKGVGQDVERGGQKLEDASDNARK